MWAFHNSYTLHLIVLAISISACYAQLPTKCVQCGKPAAVNARGRCSQCEKTPVPFPPNKQVEQGINLVKNGHTMEGIIMIIGGLIAGIVVFGRKPYNTNNHDNNSKPQRK